MDSKKFEDIIKQPPKVIEEYLTADNVRADSNLDSFYKYKDPMSNGFKLTLEFSDFGNIKEIQEVK